MNLADFIPFLGAPDDDPALLALMGGLGYKTPLLPPGRDDTKYIEDKPRGFHMAFRDEGDARQPLPRRVREGAFILINVTATTANKRGFKAFAGGLPRGLKFEMPRAEVRRLLGAPSWSSDAAPLDRWHFPDHRLIVECVREETSIRIVAIEYP